MKIICFHLYNDYSGSPKVLRMSLQNLLEKGYRVNLITSRGGVLDELDAYPNLKRSSYAYRFSTNPAATMLRFCLVQIYTFFLSFRYLFQRDTVFYINTLLPVGPALAGRIMRKRVIYHYHENAFIKGTFYKMLCSCMQTVATKIMCVSRYQASFLNCGEKIVVIPNALPDAFVERFSPDADAAFQRKQVLMLGSLKGYKGTAEFIRLAKNLASYPFCLVINDTQENIDSFLSEAQIEVPQNLTIYPRQNDVIPFYNEASLVLNLSNKNEFIETFGLTALEAMSAGLPVIVPTVGGIAEMVENEVNGYKIDVQDLDRIEKTIDRVLSDPELYKNLSENALKYSRKFNAGQMTEAISKVLFPAEKQ